MFVSTGYVWLKYNRRRARVDVTAGRSAESDSDDAQRREVKIKTRDNRTKPLTMAPVRVKSRLQAQLKHCDITQSILRYAVSLVACGAGDSQS